ncbi:MAG: hypothetical protein EAZ92_00865 [Candidatus Kapaibacterium sp.]|nr:MAG: hypothetical protein EAZ92_00865 [Candidatus Kapabacteria bacterium]
MEISQEVEAPATELERQLALIWSELLNAPLEKIGRHTSFFELGGDSISAIQLTVRVRALGLQISSSAIFKRPTLILMAAPPERVEGPRPSLQPIVVP